MFKFDKVLFLVWGCQLVLVQLPLLLVYISLSVGRTDHCMIIFCYIFQHWGPAIKCGGGRKLIFFRKCLPYNGKKTFSDPIETFKTPLFFTPPPPQVGQYFRHPRRFLLPAPSPPLSLPPSLPPSLPNLKVWPLNWKLYSEVMWS